MFQIRVRCTPDCFRAKLFRSGLNNALAKESSVITSEWKKRGQRFWLVVLLPTILFCFVQSYRYFQIEAENRSLAYQCTSKGMGCPEYWDGLPHSVTEGELILSNRASRAEDTAESYLLSGLVALVLPFLLLTLLQVLLWIWHGPNEANELKLLKLRDLWLGNRTEILGLLVGIAIVTIVYLVAPQKSIETMISASIQTVGVVFVVWLYNRSKRR
jgi:hypothetical protein